MGCRMEFEPLLGLCAHHKREFVETLIVDRSSEFQVAASFQTQCDVRDCSNLAEYSIRQTLTFSQPHLFLKRLEATEISLEGGHATSKKAAASKKGKRSDKPEFTALEEQVIQAWFQKGWLVESRVEFWHQDVVNIHKASSNPVLNVDFDALAIKLKSLSDDERLKLAEEP